ncbi:hypothetical protein [Roseibium alexandrii]|uniref:hypothetical protein n=1 Tax=Roseibium alexandrii TaxID=388408 RepID=UPI003752461B
MNNRFLRLELQKNSGEAVECDARGFVCLQDIWAAAGYPQGKHPQNWYFLPDTQPAVQRLIRAAPNANRVEVIYLAAAGRTFAVEELAMSYAEYLSLDVAESLNYALQQLVPPAPTNDWLGQRALGRQARNSFTDTLKDHGVTEGRHYAGCTNAVYEPLFGDTAKGLKKRFGLAANDNLRDNFNLLHLSLIAAVENLAVARIQADNCNGFEQCRDTAREVAGALKITVQAVLSPSPKPQKY